MAVLRRDVLASGHGRVFVESAVALSQRDTGVTPAQLNRSGIVQSAPGARLFGSEAELNRALSWWDLFAWWHLAAMSWPTAVGNRAHRASIFLPWHRLYLRRLEEAMQVVSGDASFALPYWDWARDGALAAGAQPAAPTWSLLGASRGTVTDGVVGQLRVRLYNSPADGRLYVGPPRRIWRAAGQGAAANLPTPVDQVWSLADGLYDQSPWDVRADSFRNKLEGFQNPREDGVAGGPWMHNRVHVWVGGEMAPGTSPNDPVFWLNHCNVDRIWEGWMQRRGRTYRPAAGEGPSGQRASDPLFSIVWPSMNAGDVLNPSESGLDWYRYDVLPG